jgi:predicted transcriptional regulator
MSEKKKKEEKKKGRPFNYDTPIKRYSVSVSVPKEMMDAFLDEMNEEKAGVAFRKIIESYATS